MNRDDALAMSPAETMTLRHRSNVPHPNGFVKGCCGQRAHADEQCGIARNERLHVNNNAGASQHVGSINSAQPIMFRDDEPLVQCAHKTSCVHARRT
jgi:hypothetical protein